jgi:hypothetical protein
MIIVSRDRVISLRKSNPDMTLIEIGNEIGITKERVRQILASEHLETRSTNRIPAPMPLCKQCGMPVPYRKRIFCSAICHRPASRVTVNCHYCGKEMSLMASVYKSRSDSSKYIHCSRTCRDNSRRGQPMKRYEHE